VDVLEIAEPDLIVTDAIEIGLGGSRLTEHAYPLGIIIMATNAVAHDATVARILGLHPERIEHIRLAHERGLGPIWANEIQVDGDMRIGEANAHVRSFGDAGNIPLTEFPAKFEREMRREFPLEVLAAPAASRDAAGAPGVVLDALYLTYDIRWRRAEMVNWPAASILASDGFEGAVPDPVHGRVFVVGDRAIEAWRRLGWPAWGFSFPCSLRAMFGGPGRIERFSRPDGGKGWAILVPGDPPSERDLSAALVLGTRGRIRPSVVRFDLVLDATVRAIGTWFRRMLRNLGGIETVEAAHIARLKVRKAARDPLAREQERERVKE
jgi:hypothetical protein